MLSRNKKNYVMNGSRFLFDTNAIIALLKGNSFLDNLLFKANFIATSVINILEFLSFSEMTDIDRKIFNEFISRITIINLSDNHTGLIETIAGIRIATRIKLPDAIIAGTAISINAILLTNDKGFSNIPKLQIHSF